MSLDKAYWMCRRFRVRSGRVVQEVWATGQRRQRLIEKAAAAHVLWPTSSFIVRKSACGAKALRAFGKV